MEGMRNMHFNFREEERRGEEKRKEGGRGEISQCFVDF